MLIYLMDDLVFVWQQKAGIRVMILTGIYILGIDPRISLVNKASAFARVTIIKFGHRFFGH